MEGTEEEDDNADEEAQILALYKTELLTLAQYIYPRF